ncbi:PQQ-dependent sugar dehydrogenase [Rossellomorea marisflavi]|uniref:PQQ-dependent sugar dehydrogenase n=1 Tax=Rossellomorea marisflavi TaxID=189381 RepID=UPI0040448704
MKHPFIWIIFSLVLIAGCADQEEKQQEEHASVEKPSVEYEVVADALSIPWSIDQDGETLYVTERTGSIVEVQDGKKVKKDVSLEKPLSDNPEAGLLGFVLHPDFSQNQQAYAYYTYDDEGSPYNRVVLLERQDGSWIEKSVLLDRIPSGQFHHGGRLKIGPDEKLYITTGDATNDEKAQDPEYLGGKILRMNLDGSIPGDNPSDSYLYSYGHRNPQGLAWDGETLYATEHGPKGYDEVNQIEKGANYGWPEVTGDEEKKGTIPPLVHSGEPSWAPSGADFSKGELLFATLAGQSIKQFDPVTKEVTDLLDGFGRIRDVHIDGETLYFTTNNTDGRGIPREQDDKLYKVDLTAIEGKQ